MSAADSVLFIDYATTVKLLPVPDAMAICEDVFRMHARNSVKWSERRGAVSQPLARQDRHPGR